MSKLKDAIPPGFFKLFGTKHRPVLIRFLLAIYQDIYDKRSEFTQGLTAGDCRDIFYSLRFDEDPIDESLPDYEDAMEEADWSKHLRFLTDENIGWLSSDYDETIGEDRITIPEYSRVFISVFQRLNEDREGLVSLRQVYSSLYTFERMADGDNPDSALLSDAMNSIKTLNSSLKSIGLSTRKLIEVLMHQENGDKILEIMIDEIERDKKNAGDIGIGNFAPYMRETQGTLGRIDEKIGEKMDYASNAIAEKDDESEQAMWQSEYDRWYSISDKINQIKIEVERTVKLQEENISIKNDMLRRALQKYRYAHSAERAGAQSRLMQLISMLSAEKRENGTRTADIACSILGPAMEPDSILDHELYEGRDKKEDVALYLIPEADSDEEIHEMNVPIRHTQKELDAFQKRCTSGGKVRIVEGEITTNEDLMLLLDWCLSIAGTDLGQNLENGRLIRVRDGYAYTEMLEKESER